MAPPDECSRDYISYSPSGPGKPVLHRNDTNTSAYSPALPTLLEDFRPLTQGSLPIHQHDVHNGVHYSPLPPQLDQPINHGHFGNMAYDSFGQPPFEPFQADPSAFTPRRPFNDRCSCPCPICRMAEIGRVNNLTYFDLLRAFAGVGGRRPSCLHSNGSPYMYHGSSDVGLGQNGYPAGQELSYPDVDLEPMLAKALRHRRPRGPSQQPGSTIARPQADKGSKSTPKEDDTVSRQENSVTGQSINIECATIPQHNSQLAAYPKYPSTLMKDHSRRRGVILNISLDKIVNEKANLDVGRLVQEVDRAYYAQLAEEVAGVTISSHEYSQASISHRASTVVPEAISALDQQRINDYFDENSEDNKSSKKPEKTASLGKTGCAVVDPHEMIPLHLKAEGENLYTKKESRALPLQFPFSPAHSLYTRPTNALECKTSAERASGVPHQDTSSRVEAVESRSLTLPEQWSGSRSGKSCPIISPRLEASNAESSTPGVVDLGQITPRLSNPTLVGHTSNHTGPKSISTVVESASGVQVQITAVSKPDPKPSEDHEKNQTSAIHVGYRAVSEGPNCTDLASEGTPMRPYTPSWTQNPMKKPLPTVTGAPNPGADGKSLSSTRSSHLKAVRSPFVEVEGKKHTYPTHHCDPDYSPDSTMDGENKDPFFEVNTATPISQFNQTPTHATSTLGSTDAEPQEKDEDENGVYEEDEDWYDMTPPPPVA